MRSVPAAALLALALVASGCAGWRGGGPDDGMFAPGAGAGYSGGGLGGVPAGAGGLSTSFLPGTSISDRVFFATDASTLSPEATAVIDAQVGWLQQNAGLPITVEGHADERGTREYNLALGARRASAVRNYMVARGIPDGRISTITFGRERPVATCSEESCFTQNRRAVTVVTGGAGV